MLRRALGWTLLAALLGAAGGGSVRADPGQASSPGASGLEAERQRLRAQLDRLNGEIDALKREGRGLRDDYRLRNRMADAEALARRLTEVEARLQVVAPRPSGAAFGRAALAAPPWPAAPEARPTDDGAVLEAKADILSDQARRLNGQAATLAARVHDLQGRQELRRRAGQLERDPFSPLDQAKRRLAAGSAVAATADRSVPAPAQPSRAGDPPVQSVSSGGPSTFTTGTPTLTGAGSSSQGVTSTTAGTDKAQPSLIAPASSPLDAAAGAGSLALQFRGILDVSTLAEIRRLEGAGGTPAGNLPALQRALAALRERATQLSATAASLRAQAKTVR